MSSYIAEVSPLEASLMARVQNQEADAFQELFTQFQQRIYGTAFRILKEKQFAEDALQETFLNVYRAAPRFRGDSTLATWIHRIAVNASLEILRRNRKHQQRSDLDISSERALVDPRQLSPYDSLKKREIGKRVAAGLEKLGDKHREVIYRHDLEGYTIREIAIQLNVAEGTVKSRLFYGRELLKRRFASRLN